MEDRIHRKRHVRITYSADSASASYRLGKLENQDLQTIDRLIRNTGILRLGKDGIRNPGFRV